MNKVSIKYCQICSFIHLLLHKFDNDYCEKVSGGREVLPGPLLDAAALDMTLCQVRLEYTCPALSGGLADAADAADASLRLKACRPPD